MSLQGINAYTSNMLYGSLFGNNGAKASGSGTMDLLKSLNKVDQNTSLKDLMDKVDLTRTKGWQKSMIEEYRKVFKGGAATDDSAKNSELALSDSAKKLGGSVKDVVTAASSNTGDNAAIQGKVKDFVSNYNDTIDGLKNSQSTSALRSGVSLVSASAAYSKSLSSIGVNVGKDNKLSIDEDKLSKASASDIKAVFGGQYSYGSKVADKAGAIDRNAQIQANTYNYKGKQNNFFGYSVNSIFSKSF